MSLRARVDEFLLTPLGLLRTLRGEDNARGLADDSAREGEVAAMMTQDSEAAVTPVDKYSEYTFFAGNTQTLADRRQSATQLYLTVNTSIFALIGFLLNDAGLEGRLHLVAFPLFAVGILVCLIWDRTICRYRTLIHWRFEQLMEMERSIPGSYQMFIREKKAFFDPEASKQTIAFSKLERWLPHVILGIYIVYGASFLIGFLIEL